jgi:hypothetical protein
MPRNDFQQQLDEEWIIFRKEVHDLHKREPDLTLAQLTRALGAEIVDVERALRNQPNNC